MIEFFRSNEFWAALIGAIATVSAVWIPVYLGLRKLRDAELGRLRIKCATELISFRFTLAPEAVLTNDAKVVFHAALNAIPALFGKHDEVMRLLRDFREGSAEKKDIALLKLIRATADASNVPLTSVTDIDLMRPFSERREPSASG